ncbi:CRISPR-associated helicase, Cas3 family [Desulfobulbus propionicus DSM 2032]|uniref:CRISPR-associated helicase, Cas3 family n=1 Tax=Desulfobulbus propionicus (strain ATCC 33891 / DSM 2032 / VKM B-1956 / 1pr3) TaxID=577650 RepID=A0A7U4DP06_DESPD|nr:CRISPR-associated helicase/endonuclease Cas3 [Desulfobulbus propionicus]ADW17641.1 CRISPR-associated helicase, Cas3 family [Desulfobulbus propionicus DSM 2032]
MNHHDTLVPVAHSKSPSDWQSLEAHLEKVAELAEQHAMAFGAASWGRLVGLWHDLGKFSPDFQEYIRQASEAHLESKQGRVNHSSAGALLAIERFGKIGRILAYCIMGHHAGLPDWQSEIAPRASLAWRLEQKELLPTAIEAGIPTAILNQALPTEKAKNGTGLSRSLWLRMLFSSLVDADFLDTEAFMDPEKARRRQGYPTPTELAPLFDRYMTEKTAGAPFTKVNRIRAEVLQACREKAADSSGLFTLTVPTGGGKTLSSLAFSLCHATFHGKRRIIYVIPYTSIIEQTADQFRAIFGEAVLEHHSNLDVADVSKEDARSRLACENWDAPLIVTTTVQFFESLFASRTSRCRKLHNIAQSVVILDEAQLLPTDFLKPVLEVMRELQENYGVTFVLSTATQPALGPHKSMDFDFAGLPGLREIIPPSLNLYERLQRTRVKTLEGLTTSLPWDALASRLSSHESVLCIVNRRDDARVLWEKMPVGTFHLSALMCGAHRSERIAEIKANLKAEKPTRVVSTQLVEAGVDLDFPVVYRALAGLDSVAQAAGRCNREGALEQGMVYIFQPESKIPAGYLRQAAEIGRQLLMEQKVDPLAPERFEQYFRMFYWLRGSLLDKENILELLGNDPELRISFRTAAEKFKLIDEGVYVPVLVQYGEKGCQLIDLLRRQGPERWILRQAQRYVVNLPRSVHGQLLIDGAIEEIHPGIFVQGHGNLYDRNLGFCADRSLIYAPDELMI